MEESCPYILGRGLDLSYALGLDRQVTKKLEMDLRVRARVRVRGKG